MDCGRLSAGLSPHVTTHSARFIFLIMDFKFVIDHLHGCVNIEN